MIENIFIFLHPEIDGKSFFSEISETLQNLIERKRIKAFNISSDKLF